MDNKTNIPYKMIALDLDGTLTNHEKVVTPKTREALLRAQERGAVIVLASGRPTYGIEPVAECLEMESRGGLYWVLRGQSEPRPWKLSGIMRIYRRLRWQQGRMSI